MEYDVLLLEYIKCVLSTAMKCRDFDFERGTVFRLDILATGCVVNEASGWLAGDIRALSVRPFNENTSLWKNISLPL